MTFRAEVADLRAKVALLADAWHGLELAVCEDRPPGDGLAVADHLGDIATEGTAELLAAARTPATADGLYTTATALLWIRRRIDDEYRSPATVTALLRGARERETEWRGWVKGVRRGADRCVDALRDAEDAMLRCWREAVELAVLDGCGADR
ncbi:hypothetical protein H4696_009325 [Amycolatopsis lexingtonensis]|uniref:DUF4254 domain-containing protein n=1 Tax=Amycolatopsis lexingtonensis TaxID=218822 RepID=A0ABR9IGC5_9PSEU|nr:hypothetical protein [Amycolatopsis lexingtonensis]MBE1502225.1 hypothetical protein [Amycolatopsis lexingtonensis]